jgi:hypothetical protein
MLVDFQLLSPLFPIFYFIFNGHIYTHIRLFSFFMFNNLSYKCKGVQYKPFVGLRFYSFKNKNRENARK